jgi:hypothetical protein
LPRTVRTSPRKAHTFPAQAGLRRKGPVPEMWTVIYMAQTKEIVRKVQELLEAQTLAVRIRPVGDGGDGAYYELLVPDSEVQLAHGILIANGY